jgi:multidrug resistance efflux pump
MSGSAEVTNSYDLRRQSRGGEAPAAKASPWRQRLLLGGVALGIIILLSVVAGVWHHLAYVPIRWARVQSTVLELSPRLDGRILAMAVKEGDTVRSGQVLARLDDRELQAALTAVEAELAMRDSALREAEAKEALAKTRVDADITVAESQVAVAQARVAGLEVDLGVQGRRVPEQIRVAEAVLAQRQAELQALRAGPRVEDLDAARERVASARATLALCELEVKQSRELVDEGIDSQYILAVRKTRLETQQHTLKEAELALQKLQSGARTEELEVALQAVAREQATAAQVRLGEEDLQQAAAGLQVRAAELREAQALLLQAQARRAELVVARQQTAAAEAEVRRQQAVVDGRRAALADVDLVSPIDGIVTRIFNEVGETSRRGEAVLLISDPATPRWIDAYVDEEDARRVAVGQVARVTVPANSSRHLQARVTQVGLHTTLMDHQGTAVSVPSTMAQPDSVWVRLAPLQPLDRQTVTGTTARGKIRVQ